MKIKPFLKWAGGKRQLLDALQKCVPEQYDRYFEPFVGGGALFFHLQPQIATIGDSNEELINTYTIVRDNVADLIEELSCYPHTKEFFYEIRSVQPSELSPLKRAARFIYLNRTCFNGLYRVNKKGQFNVPFGSYKNPNICDVPTLTAASEALQNVEIRAGDYWSILSGSVRPSDFVFLDPPYYPVSEYSDFKRYTKAFFYAEDHRLLATRFAELSEAGVYVILTNSNAPFVRELYSDFYSQVVDTNRNINSIASRRTKGEDLVVLSKPLQRILN